MAEFIISKENGNEMSHMFGNPIVCDDFEWPMIANMRSDAEMAFLCQIECSALKSELLPQEGILYFFYDAVNQPGTPNVKNGAKVIWYNGNEELSPLRLVDENGQDVCLPARGLIPAENGDIAIMLEDEEDEFSYEEEFADEEADDVIEDEADEYSVIIARFNCYEDDEISFNFENGTQLYFLMKKEDLDARDFSDVRVMVV